MQDRKAGERGGGGRSGKLEVCVCVGGGGGVMTLNPRISPPLDPPLIDFCFYCRFVVNRLTGEITVRRCATPGSGNCLDAETKPFYDLIFLARDNFAEGFVEQVGL